MIITRTPVRISLLGGGTDHRDWLKEYPGAVISTTINKYVYLMIRDLPPFFKYKFRLRYRLSEKRNTVDSIKHPAIKESLKYLNIQDGIELVHSSDLPARSGVGSSSSFVVSLLHALYAMQGKMVDKRKLANDAIYIEQNKLKENVGSQDQIAAAFGGLNKIEFYSGNFDVQKIIMHEESKKRLEENLMIFFTGFARTSSDIAGKYIKTLRKKNKKQLKKIYNLVSDALKCFHLKDIDGIGELLHESWVMKRSLSSVISNKTIDDIYNTAMLAGAIGGKICGAGSGGMMLFYCPKEKQEAVKYALRKLLYIPFKFENNGSQIILYNAYET